MVRVHKTAERRFNSKKKVGQIREKIKKEEEEEEEVEQEEEKRHAPR